MILKKASFEALTEHLSSKQANPMIIRAQHFLKKMNIHSGEAVLDIGCRDGLITQFFANHFPKAHFTALTKTREFLKIAQEKQIEINKKTGTQLDNIEFHLWDLARLPFYNQFDVAISFCFLHWTTDKQWVMNNIYQALKPGGRCYIQFFPDHGRKRFDHFIEVAAQQEKWQPYFKNFESRMQTITPGKFAEIAESAGFLIESIEVPKHEVSFPSINLFEIWLMTVSSHIDYIPNSKIKEFFVEIMMEYIKNNPLLENGHITHADYLLEAVLHKNNDTN